MPDTYFNLVKLLSDNFDVPAEEISRHVTLGDLGLDSLAAVELFVIVDREWNITLDEGEAVPDRSIQEVVSYVDECAAKAHTKTV
ncbi:acyl carrier protein [Streptomyces sp. V4I8]|uniref:acyl carrier protein n=1 Tax=Streptomyces sp. V4I8 TaxID=3156469 RepID=UPI0035176164